ncbi:MAG: NADH-quinone oxidoreductase subunit C [Elusimicrobia bacterium]|nr:NADH-quinone oxidoreductase subunit C [Elusimicrobiota bacterium]
MSADAIRGERRDVEPARCREELAALKADGYNVLVDMTCVDHRARGRQPRFDVIYRLMKFDAAEGRDLGRVEVHCGVDEAPVLRSVMDLWPIADWLEREVWDMFGVRFADRPDIKRLLMYETFEGHPLRKDYPIAKRQPLIGPMDGNKPNSPSFNILKPTVTGE